MLRSLIVRDFAIVDRAELTFERGMTVLSGETGAGKSLIVDALMLLGGSRADAGVVRAGAERAELSGEFDITKLADVRAALRELELDAEDECRIRRVIRVDGSSRAFINDQPVTIATLKQIAEQIFEIHGQHEHQALLSKARQLDLLDAYGGHEAQARDVARAAAEWRTLEDEIAALRGRAGASGEVIELLRHQLKELEKHALDPNALRELEDEHRRLANAGELIEGCARAGEALDGDDDSALRTLLSRVQHEVDRLAALDPALAPIASLLGEASTQVEEAADQLERYRSGRDLDPDRLAAVDEQLGKLHDLARKHRVHATELKAREASLREEFESLAGADERLSKLVKQQADVRATYDTAAAALSARRTATAKKLAREVTKLMAELGMAAGRFDVELTMRGEPDAAPARSVASSANRASETTVVARPGSAVADGGGPHPAGRSAPSATGNEACEFLVAANPGQPPRALRKVASGGELSRIGLAIEVAALGKDTVGTMVFDEVDAGIGGAVAEVVGRKLRELARERQVLCVTHLAQVAAQAHAHIAVAKKIEAKTTRTELTPLSSDTRREEIARMLGGIKITAETRALADAMLKSAGSL